MITVETVSALREKVTGWRAKGEKIALVPTMGNLHAGHLGLVSEARQLADRVVVSIFVNPLQFGAGEDFASYPKTEAEDVEKLTISATDLLFLPDVKTIYPKPQTEQTRIEVPGISDILCGASRPGHFAGVATVVCKLFNMVQPDLAIFGEKDFQQLVVIRRMVEDLSLPVTIHGHATVRESDGLALSSRNSYLTADERTSAPALYRALQETAAALKEGNRDYDRLQEEAMERLEAAGFRRDYFQIRRSHDLTSPSRDERSLVIVAAAYLGRARLIDNLQLVLD
ncbi:MAG: pantoate--beta-alanine ligase [Candidatus Sedimenticola sp. (ex Thyasira tokunagai)]